MQLARSSVSSMLNMKLTPNLIIYSAAISACENGGQWQLELSLLSSMPNMKVTLDVVSYSTASSAWARCCAVRSARCSPRV